MKHVLAAHTFTAPYMSEAVIGNCTIYIEYSVMQRKVRRDILSVSRLLLSIPRRH
jgi:hypothetical protein